MEKFERTFASTALVIDFRLMWIISYTLLLIVNFSCWVFVFFIALNI